MTDLVTISYADLIGAALTCFFLGVCLTSLAFHWQLRRLRRDYDELDAQMEEARAEFHEIVGKILADMSMMIVTQIATGKLELPPGVTVEATKLEDVPEEIKAMFEADEETKH